MPKELVLNENEQKQLYMYLSGETNSHNIKPKKLKKLLDNPSKTESLDDALKKEWDSFKECIDPYSNLKDSYVSPHRKKKWLAYASVFALFFLGNKILDTPFIRDYFPGIYFNNKIYHYTQAEEWYSAQNPDAIPIMYVRRDTNLSATMNAFYFLLGDKADPRETEIIILNFLPYNPEIGPEDEIIFSESDKLTLRINRDDAGNITSTSGIQEGYSDASNYDQMLKYLEKRYSQDNLVREILGHK